MSNEWINTTKNLVKKLSNVIYVRRNQAGIQLEETSTFRFCYDNKENCYKNSKNWSKQRLIQFSVIYLLVHVHMVCAAYREFESQSYLSITKFAIENLDFHENLQVKVEI